MKMRTSEENGVVTVEATISLTAFMFAIITILTIVNIALVQAKVAIAINTTARELSQYSYLYSLTGFNKSEAELAEAGKNDTQSISTIMTNVDTVFNEIQNLGNTGKQEYTNIDDITNAMDSAMESINNMQTAGGNIEDAIKDIADDPKKIIYGMSKLVASKGLDFAKSRLIAAPLSKAMCKKHLVNSKGGNVEDSLKELGVVKKADKNTYLDSLDFSNSTIFPSGSNEITVDVSYDVKVIALLPIKQTFHFHQKAVTHGWLTGESAYRSRKDNVVVNNTLWTEATVTERANYIRNMAIKDLQDEGYKKTAGLTDVQMYSTDKKEFVMISSMNPLYSEDGEDVKSVDDLSTEAIKMSIERLCGKMKSTTDGLKTVETKTTKDGVTTKTSNDCSGASNKVILVIPEDTGLKEKMEEIIKLSDTKGVSIELVQSYGNGASKTTNNNSQEEE